ncbi:MAG TPA: hypothetical protein VIF62_25060 [Labilithrix sp.]|jgi:hypothetical protein
MRTVLLACLGLFTLAACGDASQSTGLVRHGVTSPDPGAADTHDPNDPGDQTSAPSNPNANQPPDQPSNPGTTSGSFDVAVDNATPAVNLGDKLDINVTITPKSGFTGTANLSITGLPTGVTGTFAPASVTLNTTAATSKLTLSVPLTTPTTAIGAAANALVISAASGSVSATANANFKVNAKMTIKIPMNVQALRQASTRYIDDWSTGLVGGDAIGTSKTPLLTQTGNPISLTVINGDSAAHIVHGQNGIAHGDTGNPVPPGATDPKVRNLAVGTNGQGYPHDGSGGVGASFQIQINASP